MASKKVAVIGAGYVGSSIAYALTLKEIAQDANSSRLVRPFQN